MSTSKSVVLITGANQGIGFESAAAIGGLSSDYHVIIGSRSVERGQTAVADLQGRKLAGSFSVLQLDVTDAQSIAQAVQSVEKDHGRLDALINNAGIVVKDESSLVGELRKTFETNAIAPAVVTQAFLPLLKKAKTPRLIYVSSDLGSIAMRADPNNKYYSVNATAYRMSKAALNMLAICHQKEFQEFGIKVWTFNPGFVVTNLTGEADREMRVKHGAGSSTVSGQDVAEIIDGKRDGDAGKFIHGKAGDHGQNLGATHPW